MRRHLSKCFAALALGLSITAGAPGLAQQPQPTTGTGAGAAGATTPTPAPMAAQTAPAPTGNESPEERAMALFRKGIEAHKLGQLVEAEGYYRSAFELKKSYDIAGNLGDVELKLGKTRDAAEHLSFTIRNFPLTGKPELRDRMQKALSEARQQVGAIRVGVNVDRADIFIDGQKIGQSPLGEEYFVDPGAHSFEARLKGYKPAKQAVQATKGTLQEIKLTLIAVAPPPPEKRSKVPAAVLGVVAGVGFGVGLGTFLAANSKLSKAEALTTEIDDANGTCKGSSPHASCDELSSAKSTVNTLDAVAVSSASIGGLALVGMIVYLALPNPAAPARPTTGLRVNVLPTASQEGGGFLVTGSF